MGAEWQLSPSERLLAKAVRNDVGCLIWTGYKTADGYGRMGYQGKTSVSVHRIAYLEWVEPIPLGMQPDHLCHTLDDSCTGGPACPHRACIEPTHLELVTPVENTRRGRSFSAINTTKTECPAGHKYDEGNTIYYGGRRYCRPCMYQRIREYKSRKRAE